MRKEIFALGERYHIYNRGTGKIPIYQNNEDRERFLRYLQKYLFDFTHQPLVSMSAFALMPNHFHLILQQSSKDGISKYLRKVCQSYALYFNKKYNRAGCLFSGNFKARHISDDAYFLHLTRYIHRNPIVLTEKQQLHNYPWSSYPTYLGIASSPIITDRDAILMFKDAGEYKEFVDLWRDGEDVLIENLLLD